MVYARFRIDTATFVVDNLKCRYLPGYDQLPKRINIPKDNISPVIDTMEDIVFVDYDAWIGAGRRICDEITTPIECTDHGFFAYSELPFEKIGFPLNKIVDKLF